MAFSAWARILLVAGAVTVPTAAVTAGTDPFDAVTANAVEAATAPAGVATEVGAILGLQADAWSRGDLVAFCTVYAEDAAFVTPKGLTRGRATILERYRTSYPDRAAMGRLTIEVVDARPIPRETPAPLACSVVARWRLALAGGAEKSGLTLLVFEKVAGAWRIVHDASM